MIVLEREQRSHVVNLPRAVVERMLARTEARWKHCRKPEDRDAAGRLMHFLRACLRDHFGRTPTVEVKSTANHFAWIASIACDGVDGLLLGNQLSLGE